MRYINLHLTLTLTLLIAYWIVFKNVFEVAVKANEVPIQLKHISK